MKHCRFCDTALQETFCDLGITPLANSFRTKEELELPERLYPLHVYVCHGCLLVQLEEQETASQIFTEYAYFSSYSNTFVKHAEEFTACMIEKYKVGVEQLVVEIASNDGYLLQHFMKANIPVLGIEPAANVAKISVELGIPTVVEFFNSALALGLVREGKKADLLIGNNVLAHVPSLNDFVRGMKILLKENGMLTMEFPHLLNMIEWCQFDTIYHEHFSYFSLFAVEAIFKKQGLALFDVEKISTHGGSLRIFAKHAENTTHESTGAVKRVLEQEKNAGLDRLESYRFFCSKTEQSRRDIISFLTQLKGAGKSMAGYGAPAKGNILLNYCGIGTELIDYTVDRNPTKQNRLLPGSHIPVFSPDKIFETKPDYVVIFPWNLKEEIMETMAAVRSWGCRFIVLIPEPIVCG